MFVKTQDDLARAIEGAPIGATIILEEGVHYVYRTIIVTVPNCTISGRAGKSPTKAIIQYRQTPVFDIRARGVGIRDLVLRQGECLAEIRCEADHIRLGNVETIPETSDKGCMT